MTVSHIWSCNGCGILFVVLFIFGLGCCHESVGFGFGCLYFSCYSVHMGFFFCMYCLIFRLKMINLHDQVGIFDA